MNSHLSSEQLECALHGEPSWETSQHLSSCVDCASELTALRQIFHNFREASTAAAQDYRRSASPVVARRAPRLAWGFAAAALFVGAATPLLLQHRTTPPVISDGGVSHASTTISDEALLNSVHDDLSSSVPESLLPLDGTFSNSTNSTNETRKN